MGRCSPPAGLTLADATPAPAGTPAGGAPACTYLSSIPWLSASPAFGTIAASGSTSVTLTFDSNGVAIGSYAGNICVESDDPVNPMVAVPVALNVVPVGTTFTVPAAKDEEAHKLRASAAMVCFIIVLPP